MMSSGLYSEAFTQWGSQESWPQFQSVLQEPDTSGRPRSSSFPESASSFPESASSFPESASSFPESASSFSESASSVPEMRSIDAVMEEFRRNGQDSPYDPEEEVNLYRFKKYKELSGMGPPGAYLRQRSWPAPEASPAVPLPDPRGFRRQNIEEVMAPSVPANAEEASRPQSDVLTEYQIRVLSSLPNSVLYSLLRDLEQYRAHQDLKRVKQPEVVECRFCKNNGEKESYYRSHRLRWQGRVVCPVLRAYHCRRCGAVGDTAHTLKYCPLTTDDERMKLANMMRSIRLGSSRRRNWIAPSNDAAGYYGDVNPIMTRDGAAYNITEPLQPLWEDVARKLILCSLHNE